MIEQYLALLKFADNAPPGIGADGFALLLGYTAENGQQQFTGAI
ncbi:hypothetical protein DSOL_5435 [Desulfosporosinus metallidurans]|uniref:Uncharacterized protein n=1 Tax=Desulfosporosinus metallidurans TaxID=1888891 RepID=A0A1Q8QAP0_9FIRM|nr:hypothetical protein DSOL_5435 [Desulfosporosinus metallidurans]